MRLASLCVSVSVSVRREWKRRGGTVPAKLPVAEREAGTGSRGRGGVKQQPGRNCMERSAQWKPLTRTGNGATKPKDPTHMATMEDLHWRPTSGSTAKRNKQQPSVMRNESLTGVFSFSLLPLRCPSLTSVASPFIVRYLDRSCSRITGSCLRPSIESRCSVLLALSVASAQGPITVDVQAPHPAEHRSFT
ncbi:hypothetical protein N658DRAFT_214997 [Parathielavia hyrcaniae]|uniref:Uncharacterized protein n=1 Tax=Parathielavia hyrcaniae TaxID=113614 RepID=A0AAN6PVG8_9PEZI|nr:hypothetical protein N658DRAFT_214997 [Parathielavia hyrcaniae]